MKWSVLAIALAILLAGCVDSGVDDQSTTTEGPGPVTVPEVRETTTTTAQFTTLTLREPDDPLEFTEFDTSTACEPNAEDSNLQVIQAFVTAYNGRDLDRLRELVSESITIADMSGIPHLGEDDWSGVTRWAEAGWEVEDRFELTRLVMYDSGSVFEVARSNDVLRSSGIDQLHHSWKTHSSNCTISHMVLYLPFEELGSAECRFWEVFSDDLAAGTTQDIREPEACSASANDANQPSDAGSCAATFYPAVEFDLIREPRHDETFLVSFQDSDQWDGGYPVCWAVYQSEATGCEFFALHMDAAHSDVAWAESGIEDPPCEINITSEPNSYQIYPPP